MLSKPGKIHKTVQMKYTNRSQIWYLTRCKIIYRNYQIIEAQDAVIDQGDRSGMPLSNLYKDVVKAEKMFTNCKIRTQKRELRNTYKLTRQTFDKAFRRAERQYNQRELENIENLCQNDPAQFWNKVNSIGPKSKSSL